MTKALALLLGLVVGLIVCGGPLYYLVLSGGMDPYIAVERVAVVEPSWTATARPNATPTATGTTLLATKTPLPGPTPTSSITPMYPADEMELWRLIGDNKCAEVVLLLNRMIAANPDYGDWYYRRSQCYLYLLANQRSISEYSDYLNKALADIDKAIALGPVNSYYYSTRALAYMDRANLADFRVDQDRLNAVAEENFKMAVAVGNKDQNESILTVDLLAGRCDRYLEGIKQLIADRGHADNLDASSNSMLGRGYVCKGDLATALKYMDAAIQQETSTYRQWTRAIILYDMGRLDDALAQLNALINAVPDYGGYRYFLRALVYYDLNQPDRARQDLLIGSGSTWGQYGTKSYVLGKLALAAGDRMKGIEQIRLAEATLPREYGPLLDRIRQELQALDMQPLDPTPSVRIARTPIPTPTLTITPRPTPPNLWAAPQFVTPVDLAAGTGRFLYHYGQPTYFRFQPAKPLHFKKVQSLTFRLVAAHAHTPTNLLLFIWRPSDGKYDDITLQVGDNPISSPEQYVTPDGEMIAEIRAEIPQDTAIDNAGFVLGVLLEDGTQAVYGLK